MAAQEKTVELHHLERDPGENENVFPKHRSEASDLLRRLASWQRRNEALGHAPTQRVSPENRDKLRALGYLD